MFGSEVSWGPRHPGRPGCVVGPCGRAHTGKVIRMGRSESRCPGRRLFVTAAGITLVTEGLLAVAAAGLFGDAALPLTGVVRVGILALLAKWAYSGSRRGKVATLVWVGFHVIVTSGALLVATVAPHWLRGVPHLGVGRVLPAIRVGVLSAFGLLLLRSRRVGGFLEGQRVQ